MLKRLIFISLLTSALSYGYSQDALNNAKSTNTSYLIRSTLGNSGLSKTISTAKGTYYVGQSIGQSSVIGTYSNKNYTIRQGFQQPNVLRKVILPEKTTLKARLYPNPFKQSVNVLFEELITDELSVAIYNQSGMILQYKIFPSVQLLNLPLDFLAVGNYILKIATENKQFVSKIVKE